MANGIEFQQVTKRYGDAKSPLVVKGVDLIVPKGTLSTRGKPCRTRYFFMDSTMVASRSIPVTPRVGRGL